MRDTPDNDADAAAGGRLSLEQFLPLMLCGAGALGILPFAIVRFLNQEWWIGLLDAAIVIGFAILGMFVLRSHRVRFASISITLLCLTGYLATLYLMGTQHLYWAYPALVVAFYLLKPEEAVVVSVLTLIATVPALNAQTDLFTTATVIITLVMTGVFAYAFSALTRHQRQQLMNLATRDPLTGAGNRRALTQKLTEVIAAHERSSTPAAMIILDLDDFKGLNDEYGHAVGDQILVQLTDIILLRIRVTDSLYRIGGEEFVIVVDGQDLDRATRLAEQLRTLVEANELAPERDVTISLGVAELSSGESAADWLRRADEALYAAKRGGRNCTRVAYGEEPASMLSPLH
ncbi:MAG: GGDEF domain-containing protein [Woeseiaceae bacterium]|nr:GGDEF domain-containing protein [Woeseiaceae bacterium]